MISSLFNLLPIIVKLGRNKTLRRTMIIFLNIGLILFTTPAHTPYVILLNLVTELMAKNYRKLSDSEILYIVLMPVFTWYFVWCVGVINVRVPLLVGGSNPDFVLTCAYLLSRHGRSLNFPSLVYNTVIIIDVFCSYLDIIVDLNRFNLVAYCMGLR